MQPEYGCQLFYFPAGNGHSLPGPLRIKYVSFVKQRALTISFLLLFAGLCRAQQPATPPSAAIAPIGKDTSAAKKDTAAHALSKPDTAAAKLKNDSLRAGKAEASGIVLSGKRGFGPAFTFMIPIVREFARLRSADENSLENGHMTQDATTRFDDNDIAWPLGIAFAWRPYPAWNLRSEAVYYQSSNSNKWTPNDTVFITPHVNSFAFKAVQISLDAEFNIDPAFLSVDNFQRLYLALGGDVAPLIFLSTERTLLNKKISSLGYGFSATFSAGVERYLSERTSFAGELGFCLGSWGNFKDNGSLVQFSDMERSGGQSAYSLALRAIKLRFAFFRWF
jgi:hypothetical protein